MSTVNLNIRIEKEIKSKSEKIFEALGLNMSTAVNVFLRQVIQENGIPFEVKLNATPDFEPCEDSDVETEKNSVKKTKESDSWVIDIKS